MDQGFMRQELNYKELKPLVEHLLSKRISVCVKGHPGVGKSDMARELARVFGFNVNDPTAFIDIRLAQRDPVELCGFMAPDRESKVAEWYRPKWIPIDKPAFIFLDEINAAVSKLHQAIAYQIVLERRVGDWAFHPDTVIMAAGNLEEDNAIVTPMSSALNNRFAHFILKPDVDIWLEWAAKEGIHPGIRAYIAFKRDTSLYCNNGSDAFASPRTWALASRIDIDGEALLRRQLMNATVGHAESLGYHTFHAVYSRINVPAIVTHGELPDFNDAANRDPSFLYALVFSVSDYLRSKSEHLGLTQINNIYSLMEKGLPEELQAIFLREVMVAGKDSKKLHTQFAGHPKYPHLVKKHLDLLIVE